VALERALHLGVAAEPGLTGDQLLRQRGRGEQGSRVLAPKPPASLLYEPMFRTAPSQVWMDRCKLQISATLAALEKERASRSTPHWLGSALSHPDIAFACALRFTREAHPALFDPARYPALAEHAGRCEGFEHFRAVCQPITNVL
jgi:glutathione S-transferase